ncbi:outer membrane protein assembly factor BamD [Candidatus Babeliales bacterium]|nr:outer membrane protein assembly factor BamD [Candidatus Babeliales bacterium]
MVVRKDTTFSTLSIIAAFSLLLFSGCAKQKEVEDMNVDELKQHALTSMNNQKHENAIEYLDKIIAKHPDHEDIGNFKLLLGDAYFKTGDYPAATKLYEHFSQYYPSDAKAEYAKYRSILAQFYHTLRTDCDQSVTKDVITACNDYLAQSRYQEYRKDVLDIQNTSEHKLINKEVYVYNFYLKQGDTTPLPEEREKCYRAARNRLANLQKMYGEKNESLQPRLLYLECKLAQRENKKSDIKHSLEKLINEHPQSQFTRMAQALVTKKKFTF